MNWRRLPRPLTEAVADRWVAWRLTTRIRPSDVRDAVLALLWLGVIWYVLEKVSG